MSATPEPEIRYFQHRSMLSRFMVGSLNLVPPNKRGEYIEVTVTPVAPQGAATPADETAEQIAQAWEEGRDAEMEHFDPETGAHVACPENPYRATTPPVAATDIPGFEGTRSALDALTIRKAKTDD